MVTIVDKGPHPSVVKEVICKNCGVTLSYVPADIIERNDCDYTGHYDVFRYIVCPSCNKHIAVK